MIVPPFRVDNDCQNYINGELTYSNCVDIHKNDSNFYGNEWYVYLGRPAEIWKQEREIIILGDQFGKVVASYSY